MKNSNGDHELRYQKIADLIGQQIYSEVLHIGDRLPSVREVSRIYGVSVSTALQAYYQLEAKGLIEARPQSGYFVRYCVHRFPDIPSKSKPVIKSRMAETEAIISTVYENISAQLKANFSVGVPSSELLPVARLNKALTEAIRSLPASGTAYEPIQGNLELRRQIARTAIHWEGTMTEDDLITTAGCMNALSYALMSVTQRGDTIAVESPVYFGILQLAQSLGLRVIEMPTDPITGVDISTLHKLLQNGKIQAFVLVSNFSNPLGCSIPDEHKKEIVRLIEQYGIPLIEDDLYGDVYFGRTRPKNCKTYDESGLVLWCSSVSKTLAPGYRVGWLAPGQYMERVKQLKMFHSVSSTTLTHEAIAQFLANGRYEHHLRKLRNTLHGNSLQYARSISEYFPEGTKLSRPQGGFMLWVEMNTGFDSYEFYKEAMRYGISIAPGRMFTLQEQYHHCLRLSYGISWNPGVEAALKQLGRIAREMS